MELVGNVTTTSFVDGVFADNETWAYGVTARNMVGAGDMATAVGATFGVLASPSWTSAAPGPLGGQVTVTWGPATDIGRNLATGYKVYAGNTAGNLSLRATVGNVSSYVATGFGPGQTMHFAVAGVNPVGDGPLGPIAQGTTFRLPDPPTNLSVTAGPSDGEFQLSWTAPVDSGGAPVFQYRIYRSASPSGPFALVAVVGNQTSTVQSNLPSNTTFYYGIVTVTTAGAGARGPATGATTFVSLPGPPTNLIARPGTAVGEAILTWNPPASAGGGVVHAYRVYGGSAPGGESFIAEIGNALTFTDVGRRLGAYTYHVTAVNERGEGGPSGQAQTIIVGEP
ncbi:MAG: fibronectin type III domain-containing protein [Euryarchaeota archaeon]|nr:fibronectin type III domain-containing protein [Euryarchaeota archaeon]